MSRSSGCSEWTSRLEEAVLSHLRADSSGHDHWHAFRVRALGVRIAAATGADPEIVEAAALLHDIGHTAGRDGHAATGASLASDVLLRCGFPPSKIPAVVTCIEHHHWQPGRAGDPPHPTAEYRAFADADRLDALGTIGIARVFAFGGAHGRPIWAPRTNPHHGPYGVSSVHHFYDKLLRLPADMYTEIGRDLAARRLALMEDFLRVFYLEWEGKDAAVTASAAEQGRSLDAFLERTVQIGDRVGWNASSVLQPDPVN